jgi:hypothetical protein
MRSTRTQIYLTQEQRRKLDARVRLEDRSLASLIREAVDHYLVDELLDPDEALKSTFGASPNLEVPSRQEWDRAVG